MTTIFIIASIFPISLMLISILMNTKKKLLPNKLIPFECGFTPVTPLRFKFSIQFFMITILFLIFDIEIVLILPLPILMQKNLPILISITSTISILIMGLIMEWKNGFLDWM